MSLLDCIGLACPGPVLRCKEEIEKSAPRELQVLVDNAAAKENVSRFLKSQNYNIVDIKKEKDFYRIIAKANEEQLIPKEIEIDPSQFSCELPNIQPDKEKQLVFITSATIGHGDDELGRRLMVNFIKTLPEMGDSLWRIILLNGGVKLATEQGEVLEELKRLEQMGVSILVCGTCLDFFNLLEQKKVGETTNMLDVVTSLQMATKVIKI